ncbi:hypothetical protein B0H34DRAFT_690634 [Crassisporium funariophilum]|nr:hypothetical protein B0H34DRAFT_690634 [Crassisporium funariophilum]
MLSVGLGGREDWGEERPERGVKGEDWRDESGEENGVAARSWWVELASSWSSSSSGLVSSSGEGSSRSSSSTTMYSSTSSAHSSCSSLTISSSSSFSSCLIFKNVLASITSWSFEKGCNSRSSLPISSSRSTKCLFECIMRLLDAPINLGLGVASASPGTTSARCC